MDERFDLSTVGQMTRQAEAAQKAMEEQAFRDSGADLDPRKKREHLTCLALAFGTPATCLVFTAIVWAATHPEMVASWLNR